MQQTYAELFKEYLIGELTRYGFTDLVVDSDNLTAMAPDGHSVVLTLSTAIYPFLYRMQEHEGSVKLIPNEQLANEEYAMQRMAYMVHIQIQSLLAACGGTEDQAEALKRIYGFTVNFRQGGADNGQQ